jgi:hypothetical protein
MCVGCTAWGVLRAHRRQESDSHAGAAQLCLPVQLGVWPHEARHVSDVHAHTPAAAAQRLNAQRVIQVPGLRCAVEAAGGGGEGARQRLCVRVMAGVLAQCVLFACTELAVDHTAHTPCAPATAAHTPCVHLPCHTPGCDGVDAEDAPCREVCSARQLLGAYAPRHARQARVRLQQARAHTPNHD